MEALAEPVGLAILLPRPQAQVVDRHGQGPQLLHRHRCVWKSVPYVADGTIIPRRALEMIAGTSGKVREALNSIDRMENGLIAITGTLREMIAAAFQNVREVLNSIERIGSNFKEMTETLREAVILFNTAAGTLNEARAMFAADLSRFSNTLITVADTLKEAGNVFLGVISRFGDTLAQAWRGPE